MTMGSNNWALSRVRGRGTATLAWVPRQATEHGVLHAVDHSTDITVLEAMTGPTGEDASGPGAPVDDDSSRR